MSTFKDKSARQQKPPCFKASDFFPQNPYAPLDKPGHTDVVRPFALDAMWSDRPIERTPLLWRQPVLVAVVIGVGVVVDRGDLAQRNVNEPDRLLGFIAPDRKVQIEQIVIALEMMGVQISDFVGVVDGATIIETPKPDRRQKIAVHVRKRMPQRRLQGSNVSGFSYGLHWSSWAAQRKVITTPLLSEAKSDRNC